MQISVKSPLFWVFAKFLIFFTASLYLITFGISGTNIYGAWDAWIPLERFMLLGVGAFFVVQAFKYLIVIGKWYWGTWKK